MVYAFEIWSGLVVMFLKLLNHRSQPLWKDVEKTVGCDVFGFAFISKPHLVLIFGRVFLCIFIDDAEVVLVIPGMYHYNCHDPMTHRA